MDNEPKNILEVITRSMALPEVGHGQEANVYPLAGEENKYVLRVRDDTDWRYVSESSSLTPVNYGYDKRSLAPALVQGEGLSIHPRQPGMSLTIYWKQLSAAYQKKEQMPIAQADTKAYVDILKMMAELPLPAYISFLEDMNFLTKRHRSIEPLGDNIMLSPGTLRWVDLGHQPYNNHIANIEKMMFGFAASTQGEVDKFRMRSLRQQIREKLREAARLTDTPLTEADTQKHIPKQRHKFSDKHTIEHIDVLPMSETPKKLRDTLNAVEKHIEKDF